MRRLEYIAHPEALYPAKYSAPWGAAAGATGQNPLAPARRALNNETCFRGHVVAVTDVP